MKSYPNRIRHDKFIGTQIGNVTIIDFSHYEKGKKRLNYFYKYRCICGNEEVSSKNNLRTNLVRQKQTSKVTFCCSVCRKDKLSQWAKTARIKYKDPVEARCAKIFSDYRAKCKRKKWKFELSFADFKSLVLSNCHYCGISPSNYREDNAKTRVGISRTLFNGIDRIDSRKGYEYGNCLSCCEDCNKAKRNLSYNQFLELIERIYSKLIKKQ